MATVAEYKAATVLTINARHRRCKCLQRCARHFLRNLLRKEEATPSTHALRCL